MKISNEAMKAAYDVAKRVREGALSRAAGIEELHQRFALNRGSAGDTISNIGYMLEGKRYVRTNNAFATEHFLEMIHRDYGQTRSREQFLQWKSILNTTNAFREEANYPRFGKSFTNIAGLQAMVVRTPRTYLRARVNS